MTNLPFGDIDRDLVARAAALRPLLAEHAARTESERQVVPEVMDALETAGLFDVAVPRRDRRPRRDDGDTARCGRGARPRVSVHRVGAADPQRDDLGSSPFEGRHGAVPSTPAPAAAPASPA